MHVIEKLAALTELLVLHKRHCEFVDDQQKFEIFASSSVSSGNCSLKGPLAEPDSIFLLPPLIPLHCDRLLGKDLRFVKRVGGDQLLQDSNTVDWRQNAE